MFCCSAVRHDNHPNHAAPDVVQLLVLYWLLSGVLSVIAVVVSSVQCKKEVTQKKEFVVSLLVNIGYLLVYVATIAVVTIGGVSV